MRLFLGIIVGAALVVGGAYVHDSNLNGPFQAQQRLVNWDVAGNLVRNTYDNTRAQIDEWIGN
jgi:hypothetical protein